MVDGTLGRQEPVISGAGWPASLAELMTYRPVRDPTPKKQKKNTHTQKKKPNKVGTRVMAQWVRTLAARPDDLILIPTIHTMESKCQLL